MTERIIYGISGIEDQGYCFYHIHLAYKDKWETTGRAYESQFFQPHKDVPDLPGWSKEIDLDLSLGYETASESPVDLGEVRKTLGDLGLEECPEFEEALQKEVDEMVRTGYIPKVAPDDLEEKYQEAIQILKKAKQGRELRLESPEKIWAAITSEEKEHLGVPDMSVYYYHGEIYILSNGLDCFFGDFMIETRRAILNEIIEEYYED